MFTPEEISRITRLLTEGVTPEQVAESFGLNHSTFRAKLVQSGYRIRIVRELEAIQAVQPAPAEPVTA